MAKRKKRKVRVTKKNIEDIRAARAVKVNKRKTSPGPWTETKTDLKVKVSLRLNNSMIGKAYGTYTYKRFGIITEKGWYPVLFNITSKSIKRDVEEHGLNNYLAACEKSLNSEENKKKYGIVVLLNATVDHSQHESRGNRFISCHAKTNKKSIKGFTAVRDKKYQVLQ